MQWMNYPTWAVDMSTRGLVINEPLQPVLHWTSRQKVKDGHGQHGQHATIEGAHGPQSSQQHTAKDAVAPEHGMQPSQQLQATVTDAITASTQP